MTGRNWLILVLILALAAFLRFYQLDRLPGIHPDEAAIGYNAYSILATGRDESGNHLPVLVQTFDWKLPGYVYLTIPFVKLFGLSLLSVRLLGATTSFLAVVLTFQVGRELFGKTKTGAALCLLAAFFMATAPSQIGLGRGSFEASIALTLQIGGLYFFFRWIRTQSKRNLAASILLSISSLYFYYAPRILVPLLAVGTVWLFWPKLKKVGRSWAIIGLVSFLSLVPLLPTFASQKGSARVEQVSLLSEKGLIERSSIYQAQNPQDLSGQIFLNRRIIWITQALKGYLANLDPSYLFFFQRKDGTTYAQPYFGLVAPFLAPFFLIGCYTVMYRRSRERLFVLTIFFIGLIPAALALPSQYPQRIQISIVMLILISLFGLEVVLKKFRQMWFYVGLIAVAALFLWHYLFYYFSYSQISSPNFRDNHYERLSAYLVENQQKYDHIYITGYHLRPYIYLLFYQKIDPEYYLKTKRSDGFGKYTFGGSDFDGKPLLTDNATLFQNSDNRALFILSDIEYQKIKDQSHFRIDRVIYENGSTPYFYIGQIL